MLKKGLAILLTAITLAGVVTPSVSIQAYARPYTNTENKNLKDCIEHTDMNVIHSLETNKGWRDESIQWVTTKFDTTVFYTKEKKDVYGKAFNESSGGYFDFTTVDATLASKVAYKLRKGKNVHLYLPTKVYKAYKKSGLLEQNVEKLRYLIGQVNKDGVLPLFQYDSFSAESILGYYEWNLNSRNRVGGEFFYARKLIKYFKDNGVDLMSLSELARYEVVSELVENGMTYDYDSLAASKLDDEMDNYPEKNDYYENLKERRDNYYEKVENKPESKCKYGNIQRLCYFYTKENSIENLTWGVCDTYASLKSTLAQSLGVDAHYVKSDVLDHAWIIAKVKNSVGKQMVIVDDYGVLTGYGDKNTDNDLKSDGNSSIYEDLIPYAKEQVANWTSVSDKQHYADQINFMSDISVPKSNYSLSDYEDVFSIRTCGLLNANWQSCLGKYNKQKEVESFDKNTPQTFADPETGEVVGPDDEDWAERWAAYVDYMQSKYN